MLTSSGNTATQATIADQIVKTDGYIAHTKKTISMLQRRRTHSEVRIGMQDEGNGLMMTMLKVLSDFEEHRRMLLELQADRTCLLPHWFQSAETSA
jgi:hypothetical protein